MSTEPPPQLPTEAFLRDDDGDDLDFYSVPRLVHHIDEGAVSALTGFYANALPAGGVVLDLMSSWVSHLPDEPELAEVIGHGMNAEELAANPRLTSWFIQDLNANPVLQFDEDALDAVLCCVGIQYLQQPIAVAAEVRRILKPGAPFLISFSNRCFWTKAVDVWRRLSDHGKNNLVRYYLEQAGYSSVESWVLSDGSACDPLIVVSGRA